jgi:tetratricopeptide (TPR) repeat protein
VSGDNQTLAFVLNELGLVAFAEEDLPEARVHFDEALSLAQEHGDDQAAGAITGNLAMVAFEQRRSREAIRLIEQSLELALRLGHAVAVAEAIDQTAMLATHEGDPRGGALLMGAAASVWQEAGTDLDITFRPLRERAAGTCRAAVGDAAFEQLWERGRSFSLSEAGEEARRVLAALLERHDRSVSLDSL